MKTVLVTGASRGIGLAIAARLVADKYRVIGLSRTESPEFRELRSSQMPDQVGFVEYDLADSGKLGDLAKTITEKYGVLWGLVNNAGLGLEGTLGTFHESDIDSLLDVNLRSPILLTKYFSRRMLAKGQGRIVNVSSIIAFTGFSGLSVYAATKAGLEGFTGSLSRELGRRGITVNCVAPGFVATDMNAGMSEAAFESVKRRAPLGLPAPEDIASMVAYLLSPEAGRITGQSFVVDGGSTA